MLLDHVGLRIFLQMIHASGAYAPGAAGPGVAAPGAQYRTKISQKLGSHTSRSVINPLIHSKITMTCNMVPYYSVTTVVPT